MYLTYEEYVEAGGKVLTEDNADEYLQSASDSIDTLTFNRIVKIGFDELTLFQQLKIKRTALLLANFLYENEDIVKSYVDSYSINGVSASIGGKNLHCEGGVVIPATAYNILAQTGLCVRRLSL